MRPKTILIIGYTWPEPASTAAGNRMLQLLHFFLERKYRLVFASTASETELSMDLNSLGIKKVAIRLNDPSFDVFIKDLGPSIVLFDRFLTEEQFGWRVAEFAPKAIRILDTEDLHSLRSTRENQCKKGVPFVKEAWLQNDMTKREIASIYRSDVSLIISSYEMELLRDMLKIDSSLLLHLPFMLPIIDTELQKSWTPFEKRKNFSCIGNGKHAPNVDALVWLKEEIWPKIRQALPTAKLFVYGAYLPQKIKEMHRPHNGFLVRGRIHDAGKVMGEARINLAPLRFGAGIKGKLILAMQTGTPSITTSIGAEGMHDFLSWGGSIADNADDFAKAAIDLYRNQKNWQKARQNGVAIINKNYQKEKLSERLDAKVHELGSNLEMHRFQNFIGSMLRHQTMQSTKYLSKWIEEKNLKIK